VEGVRDQIDLINAERLRIRAIRVRGMICGTSSNSRCCISICSMRAYLQLD